MGYDYEFRFTTKSGGVARKTYQGLLKELGIADEIAHGKKLSAGGAPQALTLKTILEKAIPETSIAVFHHGTQLF